MYPHLLWSFNLVPPTANHVKATLPTEIVLVRCQNLVIFHIKNRVITAGHAKELKCTSPHWKHVKPQIHDAYTTSEVTIYKEYHGDR